MAFDDSSIETWLEDGGRKRLTKSVLAWGSLAVATAALVILIACGKGLPTLPTPLPSPSSSPSPSSQTISRLHVEGSDFKDIRGKKVVLLGGITCCEGYPANGWPLISEPTLRAYATNGANFTHLRLGPFTEMGESPEFVAYKDAGGGKVDLNEWNDLFWQRLGGILASAKSQGVYVELDLIDSWVLERPGIHPWAQGNNINGVDEGSCRTITRPITDIQKRWLTKIIDTTRSFDNVIYQVSNESFDCKGLLQDEWELSIIDFVHGLHGAALIGTNSNRDSIEASADYVESHASSAQSPRNGKPVMVNEYGSDLSPEEVAAEMRKGVLLGSSFHYWRGGHNEAQFAATLAYLRAIRAEINAGN